MTYAKSVKNTLALRLRKKLGIKAPLTIDNRDSMLKWLRLYRALKLMKIKRLKYELKKTRKEYWLAKIATLALKLGIIK